MALRDKRATPPIFNYARFGAWTKFVDLALVSLRPAHVEGSNPYVPPSLGRANNGGSGHSANGAHRQATQGRVGSYFWRPFIYASIAAVGVQIATTLAAVIPSVGTINLSESEI